MKCIAKTIPSGTRFNASVFRVSPMTGRTIETVVGCIHQHKHERSARACGATLLDIVMIHGAEVARDFLKQPQGDDPRMDLVACILQTHVLAVHPDTSMYDLTTKVIAACDAAGKRRGVSPGSSASTRRSLSSSARARKAKR